MVFTKGILGVHGGASGKNAMCIVAFETTRVVELCTPFGMQSQQSLGRRPTRDPDSGAEMLA